MSADEYRSSFNQLSQKRSELQNKLAELEADTNDTRSELAHVDEIIAHLAPLVGLLEEPGNITGLGITEAIRVVLQDSAERISASDIRKKLEEKGFDFSGYSNPMASIYKILARLRDGDEVEVKKEGWKVFYTPKNQLKISDEDIPF